MENKSKEVYKLVDCILSDDDLVFFTYKKLQSFASLTLAEIRTIVSILAEYNIIYSKNRMGLFKNKDICNAYTSEIFSKHVSNDIVVFSTSVITVNFKKFEFELMNYLSDVTIWNASRILSLVILAHFEVNFYYEKLYNPADNGNIISIRRAITCSDDRLCFEIIFETPKLIIMR